ncbi:MAG: HlyD family efflux transporter periplasmic adaptor subunit [Chloroflexi bacterium]|nr:HlyD family efflux transporter periplasmic adaptor subunit [Chloroflexota bacterium]
MHRRWPWWILVSWAAIVAATVPLLLWGLVAGFRYANDWSSVVTASSASVSGDLVTVATVNAGRVAALHATAGARVRAGDALAEVELPAPVRTTSSGTPVLAFLGSTDQQVTTTAPVDGVVASVLVTEGSAVTAGQTIVRIIDPAHLRVTAYVRESDIARVHAGQEAEVYLAALDRTLPGVVQAVVPATQGAFATPPTGGADPKAATPVFPVTVRVDLSDHPQLLGSTAEVRIRVR